MCIRDRDSYETKLEVGRSDLFERLDEAPRVVGSDAIVNTHSSLTSAVSVQPPKVGSRR